MMCKCFNYNYGFYIYFSYFVLFSSLIQSNESVIGVELVETDELTLFMKFNT